MVIRQFFFFCEIDVSAKKYINEWQTLYLKHTIDILNPHPGLPRMFSLGMTQSSKIRYAVEDARMPSLSSLTPSDNPGVGMGTRKALIP